MTDEVKNEAKNEIVERVEALSGFEQKVLKVILKEYTSDLDEALQIVECGNYTTDGRGFIVEPIAIKKGSKWTNL